MSMLAAIEITTLTGIGLSLLAVALFEMVDAKTDRQRVALRLPVRHR